MFFVFNPISSIFPVDLSSLKPNSIMPPLVFVNDIMSFAKFLRKISVESVNPKKLSSNLKS